MKKKQRCDLYFQVCCPSAGGTGGAGGSGGNINLLPGKRACGQSESQRVYGGEDTERGEYPWMALLGYQKRKIQISFDF